MPVIYTRDFRRGESCHEQIWLGIADDGRTKVQLRCFVKLTDTNRACGIDKFFHFNGNASRLEFGQNGVRNVGGELFNQFPTFVVAKFQEPLRDRQNNQSCR